MRRCVNLAKPGTPPCRYAARVYLYQFPENVS
jgi:hypothetical protein